MISKARSQLPRDLSDEVSMRRFLSYLAEQVDTIDGLNSAPGYITLNSNTSEEALTAKKAADNSAKAASTALASADGKNTNYYQALEPTGTDDLPLKSGDLWFNINALNKMYRYNGSAWEVAILNDSITTIDGGKITTGTIDASTVNVSNINAGNITTGTMSANYISGGTISGDIINGGTITGVTLSSATNIYVNGQTNTNNLTVSSTSLFFNDVTISASLFSYYSVSDYFNSGSGSGGGAGNAYGLSTGNYSAYIGGLTYPFTGAHVAVSGNTLMEVGDIVVGRDAMLLRISQSYAEVEASTNTKDKAVFGVVSENLMPLLAFAIWSEDFGEDVLDADGAILYRQLKPEYEAVIGSYLDKGFHGVSVNALGEGGINVCSEGGDIAIGDYICSSSIAGKGMKQDDDLMHNYTVAKSLEAVTWLDEPSTLKMIACTYHCG